MESQLCCSNKLLLAMGLKPTSLPAERQGLAPLSTWYADLFYFNRRKCLVFYNPSTGYGMVAAYVAKKQIVSLPLEFSRVFRQSMCADGVSSERQSELLAAVANPVICRTSDRRSRASVVHAIRDAEFSMWRTVKSDAAAVERAGHRSISHGFLGPGQDPLKAFMEVVGEPLPMRLRFGEWDADCCDVLITIQGIRPPIWRRMMIPSAFPLNRTHRAIQGAFGWTNSHLHIFRAGGKAYEAIYDDHEEYEGADETQICLYDLLQLGGGSAEYVYDFGDHWLHTIQLKDRLMLERPTGPHCLAGERACPPEDVGGVPGYAQMLEALANPDDEEHESYIEWLPEDYDPERFSVESADDRIREMMAHRD